MKLFFTRMQVRVTRRVKFCGCGYGYGWPLPVRYIPITILSLSQPSFGPSCRRPQSPSSSLLLPSFRRSTNARGTSATTCVTMMRAWATPSTRRHPLFFPHPGTPFPLLSCSLAAPPTLVAALGTPARWWSPSMATLVTTSPSMQLPRSLKPTQGVNLVD
jgi:hypothetical protein